jgi:glucan 1,3-beta-glucosidase
MGTRFHLHHSKEREMAKAENASSYDNSGHRMPWPEWQSSQSNIDRTNNVLRLIATEFASQAEVVSAIQPLNECVLLVGRFMLQG